MIRYLHGEPDSMASPHTLVIPFYQTENGVEAASEAQGLPLGVLRPLFESGDFKGKEKECALYYVEGAPYHRILLLGLGKQGSVTEEKVRRSYAAACRRCLALRVREVAVCLPEHFLREAIEGIELANDAFSHKKEPPTLLEVVRLVGAAEERITQAQHWQQICAGTRLARSLAMGNADTITPQALAEQLQALSSGAGCVTEILDEAALQAGGFGLLLAVGGGARHRPILARATYRGAPDSEEHTVLIGKGVTFDTGGLNLKPTGSIETMRDDMAGAAAVLGLWQVVCALRPCINVSVVLPLVENAIGQDAYKPGDVFRSLSGRTVEIGNTDAEGRLILADALTYAQKELQPTRMVDLATLTGGAVIALGLETTALMGNDRTLVQDLLAAGERSGERCWELPLFEDYRPALDSDIADLRNIGKARSASSILGGMFLREFVDEVPWAHLDIAGTSWRPDGEPYGVKYASGVGVRLLAELLGLCRVS